MNSAAETLNGLGSGMQEDSAFTLKSEKTLRESALTRTRPLRLGLTSVAIHISPISLEPLQMQKYGVSRSRSFITLYTELIDFPSPRSRPGAMFLCGSEPLARQWRDSARRKWWGQLLLIQKGCIHPESAAHGGRTRPLRRLYVFGPDERSLSEIFSPGPSRPFHGLHPASRPAPTPAYLSSCCRPIFGVL